MRNYGISDEVLAVLNSYTPDTAEDIMRQVAENFRKRRVEKNISRRNIADLSGVPLATVARFEQKGLISFESLVKLAMALGFAPEVRGLFGVAKFNSMEELDGIRRKIDAKRAYPINRKL